MGTPVGIFVRSPGGEGLVCMCRTLHLIQALTIILPAIQTHSTPFGSCYQQVRFQIHLLISEQGSAPGCQPRAECIWAAIDTCLHETPHLSGTKPQNKYLRASRLSRQQKKRAAERGLDSINNSVDTNLSKLWEIVKDRHGSLACCSPWGHKELDRTYQLNNKNIWAERILQKLQRGGSPQPVDFQALGPTALSSQGKHTHMHTHTHAHTHTCTYTHTHTHICTHMHTYTHTYAHTRTHMCTHMHTRAHTRTHTHTHAHQVGVFIRKPERSTSEFMICFKSWQDITFRWKKEKKCSENPVYDRAPKPSLKSFSVIPGQSAGPCGVLTGINELYPGSSETPGLQHKRAHYSWVIPAPPSALSFPSRGA